MLGLTGVRRRIPRDPDSVQQGLVERVVRVEDEGLVVLGTVLEEEELGEEGVVLCVPNVLRVPARRNG